MKKKIKISMGQLKCLLSLSENRPLQSITIYMNNMNKEEMIEVMDILSKKKKN